MPPESVISAESAFPLKRCTRTVVKTRPGACTTGIIERGGNQADGSGPQGVEPAVSGRCKTGLHRNSLRRDRIPGNATAHEAPRIPKPGIAPVVRSTRASRARHSTESAGAPLTLSQFRSLHAPTPAILVSGPAESIRRGHRVHEKNTNQGKRQEALAQDQMKYMYLCSRSRETP